MKMSERGKEFLIREEGEVLSSYLCPAGVWTIGVGHTGSDIVKGMKITKEQSREYLKNDLKRFESCVSSNVRVFLEEHQFDALVSFAFNVGCDAFRRSTLLKKINSHSKESEIIAEFKRWIYGGGKVLPVLKARREREIKLYTREILIVVFLSLVIFVVLLKYKKEALKTIAYYAVIQAEELYKSKEGEEKLLYSLIYVRQKLPFFLRFLISERAIRGATEYTLETLQGIFKGSKEKQLKIIDNIRTYGVNTSRLNQMSKEIDKNGYIEGYIEGKTDLHGNNNIVGGLRAGKRF